MERATESICLAVTGLGHIRPLRQATLPGPFSSYWASLSVIGANLIQTPFHHREVHIFAQHVVAAIYIFNPLLYLNHQNK